MANVELVKLKYYEHRGQPLAWSFDDLTLGQINLLVGKNATGKTRVLNVINGLSRQIVGEKLSVDELNYEAIFSTPDGEMRYVLRAENRQVVEEKLYLGDKLKLNRDSNKLTLYYQKENKDIEHTPVPDEVSAAARKDQLQHPFLLLLDSWAQSLRYYHFGSQLGKNRVVFAVKANPPTELDDKNEDLVVPIFLRGKKDFPYQFCAAILQDMRDLGYPLTEVDATTPDHISFLVESDRMPLPVQGQVKAIGVREEGIPAMYFQDQISQGMFRALSILIQVNYAHLSGRATCILIDDIGEGLDFERSSLLIEKLRNKAKASKVQLIMSTNDQFVMNRVPLDEWSVLQRVGGKITIRNVHNSKAIFEDFRFVGMSNFSFFEMDFANAERDDGPQLKLEGISKDE